MDKVIGMQEAASCECGDKEAVVGKSRERRDLNGLSLSSDSGDADTGIRPQAQLEAEIARLTEELSRANQMVTQLEADVHKLSDNLVKVQAYALVKCQESDQQRMMISAYQKQMNA